jgi:nitrogenase molybdenum-cofactor synthesis protein NifE
MGVLRMKQVSRVLMNYSADLFGICSSLYELGGLTVMHDASGCNSTYNTHDEPRWFDMNSLIYVSGLCESDAVLGNDEKLIDDVCEVAAAEHPKFIALCGSPVPMIMGTDFRGIAHVVEKRTGIPSFGIKTSGMHTYIRGGGEALAAIAQRFCPVPAENAGLSVPHTGIRINLLGVTPLDFSVTGTVEALRGFFTQNGCAVVSMWAMGSTLEQLACSGCADVNVVVSALGLPAAKELNALYGTPYVTGIPLGIRPSAELLDSVRQAALSTTVAGITDRSRLRDDAGSSSAGNGASSISVREPVWIIGEPVFAASLRRCLRQDFDIRNVRIICPVEEDAGALEKEDVRTDEEEDIETLLKTAGTVIADPVYRRILSADTGICFVPFPHVAYSGRLYAKDVPVFAGGAIVRWLVEQFSACPDKEYAR